MENPENENNFNETIFVNFFGTKIQIPGSIFSQILQKKEKIIFENGARKISISPIFENGEIVDLQILITENGKKLKTTFLTEKNAPKKNSPKKIIKNTAGKISEKIFLENIRDENLQNLVRRILENPEICDLWIPYFLQYQNENWNLQPDEFSRDEFFLEILLRGANFGETPHDAENFLNTDRDENL